MQHFSIRDVENLTGIKAHTLQIWEYRFGLCTCKRKESLQRYYGNGDLKSMFPCKKNNRLRAGNGRSSK